MHVLQWIAVEADSENNAELQVQSLIDSNFFEWSDWAVIGGRWSDKENGNVISVKDEPIRASDVIEGALDSRRREVRDLLKDIDVDGVISWVEDVTISGKEEYNYAAWRLRKALETALGQPNSDSYFYDADAHSTSPDFLIEGKSKANYLVAVDFHF